MKKMNRKGFTLAELLIVIAIMAILIAIAIPVFSSQLENARHSVDDSALRSAKSIAESHYLLCHTTGTGKLNEINLTFTKDGDNLMINECDGNGKGDCTFAGGKTDIAPQCQCGTNEGTIKIKVDSNGAVSGGWKS